MDTQFKIKKYAKKTIILDIVFALIILIFTNYILVVNALVVWGVLVISTLWCGYVVFNTLYKKPVVSSIQYVRWEKGFFDWFIITKVLTSLVGVILLNVFRQKGWYTFTTHNISITLLIINISEAVTRDIFMGFISNGLTGIGLIVLLPFTISNTECASQQIKTIQSGVYLFNLEWTWIVLYTSWNCCFSYGNNMSWMTRLILIPPIVLSICMDWNAWLGARVLLLLFHLIQRATQVLWFYNPGQSYLTPQIDSISNNTNFSNVWGILNLILLIFLLCKSM